MFRYIFTPTPDNYWIIHAPVKGNWMVEDALKWIQSDMAKNRIRTKVGLLVDSAFLNPVTFSYYVYLNKLPLDVISYIEDIHGEKYLNLDYFITLENTDTEHWPNMREKMAKMNGLFKQQLDNYIKVQEFKLPYYWDVGRDNKILIYKKI